MSDKPAYPSPASVRCTAEELEQIRAIADAQGITVSALFRQAVLGEKQARRKHKRKARRPVKDKKELAKLFALLGKSRISSNINQLARAANSGSLILTPDTERSLKQACADIAYIRITLMKALGRYEDEDDGEDFQP